MISTSQIKTNVPSRRKVVEL